MGKRRANWKVPQFRIVVFRVRDTPAWSQASRFSFFHTHTWFNQGEKKRLYHNIPEIVRKTAGCTRGLVLYLVWETPDFVNVYPSLAGSYPCLSNAASARLCPHHIRPTSATKATESRHTSERTCSDTRERVGRGADARTRGPGTRAHAPSKTRDREERLMRVTFVPNV